MSKNLFDFANENIEENKASTTKTKIKEEVEREEQAKNIYEKYKDMSQKDLIEEFVSTSKQKINDGSISKEKISQTASVLSPYLNNEQKQLLYSLMERLND